MEKAIVNKLFKTFEEIKNEIDGVEFWNARDLQEILGYSKWENFNNVIEKAKISCKNNGYFVEDEFFLISGKTSSVGGRPKEDYKLSRYACYLIAQNGDPDKQEIAFAQNYFAVQTRKQEIIEQRLLEYERLNARKKQSLTEKEFHKIAFERGVDGKGISTIISKGDSVLFGGNTTKDMKSKLKVPESRPLADFLPTVTIKAKDLATEMTNHNVQNKDLYGERSITNEHLSNNNGVRKLLVERGIVPEELPPEEDIKKIERKLNSENNKLPNKNKNLGKN